MTDSKNKFQYGQIVVIPNFLINDTRMDVSGSVQRYLNVGPSKGKILIRINSVDVPIDEGRLYLYNDFFKFKNGDKLNDT